MVPTGSHLCAFFKQSENLFCHFEIDHISAIYISSKLTTLQFAFENGERMTPKRYVLALIFLIK